MNRIEQKRIEWTTEVDRIHNDPKNSGLTRLEKTKIHMEDETCIRLHAEMMEEYDRSTDIEKRESEQGPDEPSVKIILVDKKTERPTWSSRPTNDIETMLSYQRMISVEQDTYRVEIVSVK